MSGSGIQSQRIVDGVSLVKNRLQIRNDSRTPLVVSIHVNKSVDDLLSFTPRKTSSLVAYSYLYRYSNYTLHSTIYIKNGIFGNHIDELP